MTTHIRDATQRDLKQLAAMAAAFHEEHSRMIGGDAARKLSDVENEVVKFLESPNSGYLVVESPAAEIIGFRRWELHDGFYFTRELYVAPQARRHGVARALIRHFERWLLEKGQTVACVSCTPHNVAMLVLARSEGYQMLNTIEMRKELVPGHREPREKCEALGLVWDLL